MSDLWRRSYHGICRGGVCVSDLWRRSYHGVCRGGVSVSVCIAAAIMAVAEEVSVSTKSVLPECQVRVSRQECSKSVRKPCGK